MRKNGASVYNTAKMTDAFNSSKYIRFTKKYYKLFKCIFLE